MKAESSLATCKLIPINSGGLANKDAPTFSTLVSPPNKLKEITFDKRQLQSLVNEDLPKSLLNNLASLGVHINRSK